MGHKVKQGGTINRRFKVIIINNRFFIMDYLNPYKLMNYIGAFTSAIRTSYLAWEIEEEDLAKLKYKGSAIYLEAPKLFEGPHDLSYEEDIIDQPIDHSKSEFRFDFASALGFALVPTIVAIPGLNIPMWGRWLLLFVGLGFAGWYIIKLLSVPKIDSSGYKPVIIARKERYGKKMTGLRLFGRSLGFLVAVAIQIGAIYAWVTIPLRDFNIVLYLVACVWAWGMTFGYFWGDPRDEEEEGMVKYTIVEENKAEGSRLNFLTYVIVYFIIAAIVFWILTGLVFLADYLYGILAYSVSMGIALVAVIIASRNHDGYNPSKVFCKEKKI